MKTHARVITALTGGVLVLAATMALSATATAKDFGSRVTIGRSIPLYHGKVHSPRQSFCEPDRRVVLFQKIPGDDAKIGKDTTNAKGKWEIQVPDEALIPGRKFYAFVRGEDLGNDIVCEKATSKKVTFQGG
jgi:hypothetical protein